MEIIIGVDIGGTVVRAGAFSPQGELLAVGETPIEAARGPEAGLQRIQTLIQETLSASPPSPQAMPGIAGEGLGVRGETLPSHEKNELGEKGVLLGIGIGCTGPLDPIRGTINNPYTLPTWENVPIVSRLQERFSVPITLENDADVAALGEYWMGAGRGVGRLYAITVGTGIGTALIYDGQIYRGLDGSHPDGGHQAIDPSGPQCYCGARGCWESLASGSAIARMAEEAGFVGAGLRPGPTDPAKITARMVAEAALAGDPLAVQIMEEAAHYFALGVVNVITLFVPEVIVLSGGVMKSAELFMPALQQAIQQNNVMVPASRVRILPAQLGYYAGLYGAAYTILQIDN